MVWLALQRMATMGVVLDGDGDGDGDVDGGEDGDVDEDV